MSRTGMGRVVKSGSAMLLALLALPVIAADEEPVKLTGEWRVSLDAEGAVQQVTAHNRLKKPINDRVEEAIRGWRFVPGTVNGTPAPTETTLNVKLSATRGEGDAIRLRFDSVETGAAIVDSHVMPKLPSELVRSRVQGMVVLKVAYDSDGKVVAVEPVADGPKADSRLTRYFSDMAKAWTFDPERVGGHALAGSSVMPFCLVVVTHVAGFREPKAPDKACIWERPDDKRQVAQGEALALDPAARLASDVIGKTL